MSSDFEHIRDEILRISQTIGPDHKYKKLLDSLLLAIFNLCIIAEHIEEGEPFQKSDEELLEESFGSIVRATDKSVKDKPA